MAFWTPSIRASTARVEAKVQRFQCAFLGASRAGPARSALIGPTWRLFKNLLVRYRRRRPTGDETGMKAVAISRGVLAQRSVFPWCDDSVS